MKIIITVFDVISYQPYHHKSAYYKVMELQALGLKLLLCIYIDTLFYFGCIKNCYFMPDNFERFQILIKYSFFFVFFSLSLFEL